MDLRVTLYRLPRLLVLHSSFNQLSAVLLHERKEEHALLSWPLSCSQGDRAAAAAAIQAWVETINSSAEALALLPATDSFPLGARLVFRDESAVELVSELVPMVRGGGVFGWV